MLSWEDYDSLKKSCKGWDARRLARYGIKWPPIHGWRKALLREFENKESDVATPETCAVLEGLLSREKRLTAEWYARMSGEKPWMDGERETLDASMARLEIQIDPTSSSAEELNAIANIKRRSLVIP